MRHARIAVAAGIILAVSMPGTAVAGGVPPESAALIERVNELRRSSGLPTLRVSDELTGSSRGYARYMLKNDYFGHLATIRAGGNFLLVGETLEWHSGWRPSVGLAFSQWMKSPSHHAVLMNPSFRSIGTGRVRGRWGKRKATAWVAHLGGQSAGLVP